MTPFYSQIRYVSDGFLFNRLNGNDDVAPATNSPKIHLSRADFGEEWNLICEDLGLIPESFLVTIIMRSQIQNNDQNSPCFK